ncbi:unnamed protein product [Arctia plantaginis]|uniref:Uncharacterized protein n=1 Tax=Arctia plantaginis TaxID=874455 RepID=A0A8S1B387_ARCPL|nr:unnamed protein product [Arctia plantaginis]
MKQKYLQKKVDVIWFYGKCKAFPLPGWNGYIEHVTSNIVDFSKSKISFLPFVQQPASNYNTIYTTLLCALEDAKRHNHTVCIITFDQPLFAKAREIVSAAPEGSELSKIIVRLGGFHLLMSFFGAIGYIMHGSGLKEVLSEIYVPKSLEKMLNGHDYARAVRAHTLLQLTLALTILKELAIDDVVSSTVKVHDEEVPIDPVLLFQRMSVTKTFEDGIETFFAYDLAPYPLSLFDAAGMRKTMKSALYDCFQSVNAEVDCTNAAYVIDGGYLLHHVVWDREETFNVIFEKYVQYLRRHYGHTVTVVFDGYSDTTKNIKATEQRRRATKTSSGTDIMFDEFMTVPVNQQHFFANINNKSRFISMLSNKLTAENIAVKQAPSLIFLDCRHQYSFPSSAPQQSGKFQRLLYPLEIEAHSTEDFGT